MIKVGDSWKYFKGESDPGSDWNTILFDDLSWTEGPTGIGYGDSDAATELSDMGGNYVSVYARKEFSVIDHAAVTGMTLNMDFDDGFVAYLNGVEVARDNISETPRFLIV